MGTDDVGTVHEYLLVPETSLAIKANSHVLSNELTIRGGASVIVQLVPEHETNILCHYRHATVFEHSRRRIKQNVSQTI